MGTRRNQSFIRSKPGALETLTFYGAYNSLPLRLSIPLRLRQTAIFVVRVSRFGPPSLAMAAGSFELAESIAVEILAMHDLSIFGQLCLSTLSISNACFCPALIGCPYWTAGSHRPHD